MMLPSVVTSRQEQSATRAEPREEALPVESIVSRSTGERYTLSEELGPLPRSLRPTLEIEVLPFDGIYPQFISSGEFRTAYELVPVMDGITFERPSVMYSPKDGRYLPRHPVKVLPEAKRLLTQDVRELVNRLITLIMAKAQLSFIPIVSFTLRIRRYPQEKYEELVIQVSVQASVKQALAFWDSLGVTVDTWETMVVPTKSRERLASLISVSVVWG